MARYFVELKLRDRTYKDKVSTEGCDDVADLKVAIKKKFSPELDSYGTHHLTLFKPGGTTEIDPGDHIDNLNGFNVAPDKPLVVTVEEAPRPAPISSSKKQLTYKGMSTEASCRKYLDALAMKFFLEYEFPKNYSNPTIGDVLAAFRGQQGKRKQTTSGTTWWEFRQNDGLPLTDKPLSSRLSERQWETLEKLNRKTSRRILDVRLPLTTDQKPFIVLPHDDFMNKETVNDLKGIAAAIGVVDSEADFIVKDEHDLSASSGSESGSPDKDKIM